MLIGISGKIGAGKDTVAELIIDHSAKACQVRRFADRLKQTVSALTHTSLDDNYDREGKQRVPPGFTFTLGELQQKVGMALRQHVDPNVWITTTLHDVGQQDYKHIIVADVRFVNEAEAIRALGGLLIRVNGDPTGCRQRDTRNLDHPSETELDDWSHFDWVVDNDGTLEELEHKVRALLSSLGAENFVAQ